MLEKMDDFFNARAATYDRHMLDHVEGAAEFYERTASWLPDRRGLRLLDLGCGTGLELAAVFRRFPDARVTGIDLSGEMLQRLMEKFPEQRDRLQLIRADYLTYDLGVERFDGAVSVESLHHFTHEQKRGLYERLYRSLRPGGVYVETDYVAPDQAAEDRFFEESRRLQAQAPEGEDGAVPGAYHIDTPCTVENQTALLRAAGFQEIQRVWQRGCTAILTARKGRK